MQTRLAERGIPITSEVETSLARAQARRPNELKAEISAQGFPDKFQALVAANSKREASSSAHVPTQQEFLALFDSRIRNRLGPEALKTLREVDALQKERRC